MTLPHDITRCHDSSCAERHQCRRWLERGSGSIHAASLSLFARGSGDACRLQLPIAMETTDD